MMMTFMMYIILKQKFDSNNNSIKLDKKKINQKKMQNKGRNISAKLCKIIHLCTSISLYIQFSFFTASYIINFGSIINKYFAIRYRTSC